MELANAGFVFHPKTPRKRTTEGAKIMVNPEIYSTNSMRVFVATFSSLENEH
jgi:hypothetical protein